MNVIGLRRIFAVALILQVAGNANPIGAQEDRWLELDRLTETQLAAGETHQYFFDLEADWYLELEVKQDGVDVVLGIFGPGGEQIGSFDSPTQNQGFEIARAVAQASGTHRLEVSTAYRSGEEGRYRIRPRVLRRATTEDRHQGHYQRLKVETHRLNLNHAPPEDWRRALKFFERMIHHARLAGDREAEAWAWDHLAGHYNILGELLEGLEARRVALGLWQEIGHRGMEASTYGVIGRVYANLGETQKAFDYFDDALEISTQTENPRWKATILGNLAGLHISLGQYEKASDFRLRELEIWRAADLVDAQVRALNGLALGHAALGRYESALGFLETSLPLSEGSQYFDYKTTVLLQMAWNLACLGRGPEAKQRMAQALAGMRVQGKGVRILGHRLTVAQIHERLGEPEAALVRYHEVLRRFREIGNTHFVAETLYEIARVEAGQGRLPEALAAMEDAAVQIEKARTAVGGRHLRALYLASRHDYYELWIDVLMRLAEVEPGSDHAARAFGVHERSRARSLLEALSETRTNLRSDLDPELARREQELGEQLRKYVEHDVERTDGSATMGRSLTDLLAEYAEVQEQIRAQSVERSEGITSTPLSLEQVQKQVLDAHTLLLEYALGEERSYLWMVTSTSAATFKLPGRAAIEGPARTVYERITDRQRRPSETQKQYRQRVKQNDEEYREAAARLSQMLLMPSDLVEGHLDLDGIQRIVVVGEGILQYLPLGALPIPLPQGGSSQAPLGFQYEVISLPSASVIGALRRKRYAVERRPTTLGAESPKTLAVIADPALPAGAGQGFTRSLVRSIRALGLSGLARLPGALEEARSILKLVPPTQRLEALGLKASRDMVLAGGLRDYRFIHFATHSLLNSRHPDLSGIVLSLVDEEDRPQDGFLRLHDVYDLELSAELVVLSACQTALGQEIRGEGLVGLTRGFMYAGVPTVVASLWSPDDDATAVLMKHFYEGILKRGLTPAAALKEAQKTLFFEHPEWRSPYYWAPFVLQGDWLQGDWRHGS